MEKVSVIVPVYNAKDYLDNCIGSILSQEDCNLELMLVDDGSTDNSGSICDRFAKDDARVKVIHKKNAGQGEARNDGIKACSGDYICFVDNDDTLPDTKVLNRMVTAIQGYDILICDEDNPVPENEEGIGLSFMAHQLRTHTYKGTVWSKLYKRSLFVEHNVFFEGNLICEDELITPKLMGAAKSIRVVSDKVYENFWTNPSSQTNTVSDTTWKRKSLGRLEVVQNLIFFFDDNKDINTSDRRAIYSHYYAFYVGAIGFANKIQSSDMRQGMISQILSNKNFLKGAFRLGIFKYSLLYCLLASPFKNIIVKNIK